MCIVLFCMYGKHLYIFSCCIPLYVELRMVCLCTWTNLFSRHSYSRLQGDSMCTDSNSLPHRAGILATRCQIWSCIHFHVSSPVTCSKEYPLEHRGRGRRQEREKDKRRWGRQKNRTKRWRALTFCIANPCYTWFINISDTAHTVQEERNGGVVSNCDTLRGSPYFSKSTKTKTRVWLQRVLPLLIQKLYLIKLDIIM